MPNEPELHVVDRWAGGVGWYTHPGEPEQRVSHALQQDGSVWVVDPLDADGLDELLAEYGTVAGVVLALGRHKRDADEIASRHGVDVWAPAWMSGIESAFEADVSRFEGSLPGTDVEAIPLVNNRFWQEVALYDPTDGTLYVPELLGTGPFYLASGERLGVNPFYRVFPPRGKLGALEPVERVLVGHGKGVFEDADEALDDALAGSRRRLPGLVLSWISGILGRS